MHQIKETAGQSYSNSEKIVCTSTCVDKQDKYKV